MTYILGLFCIVFGFSLLVGIHDIRMDIKMFEDEHSALCKRQVGGDDPVGGAADHERLPDTGVVGQVNPVDVVPEGEVLSRRRAVWGADGWFIPHPDIRYRLSPAVPAVELARVGVPGDFDVL